MGTEAPQHGCLTHGNSISEIKHAAKSREISWQEFEVRQLVPFKLKPWDVSFIDSCDSFPRAGGA